jgi:hypothetical protein
MKYWEFTEEKKESSSGEVLRRINCTQDFSRAKKGDLGGWLGENAVLKDNAWIDDEAQVYDNAIVFGNEEVCGNEESLTKTVLSKKTEESEEKKTTNKNNIGHKETDGKLPIHTILIKQFPNAFKKLAQCSVLGHEKYKEYDEDWQNFSRVPDAYNHYLNAAVRHLLEGDKINEEDSTEAIKVNHLDQAVWNLMAAIEVKARVETVK